MRITNIRVEGVSNPIGVDEKKPVFSWEISGNGQNIFQENYRIVVRIGNDFDGEVVWDSKLTESSNSSGIEYHGNQLLSDTIYSFRVYLTVNGKSLVSDISRFTTGLLNSKMPGYWLSTEKYGCTVPETCAFVRKKFSSFDVSYATLYICSYGWYQLFLNGKKVSDSVLSPTKSSFDSFMFYEVYDVTDLLVDGENTISLILADGYGVNANPYMGRYDGAKRFIASLNLHKTNGSTSSIVSDATWKFTLNTPWIKNNIYNGEIYDATREIVGWQNSNFDDSDWDYMYISPTKENKKFYCDIGPYVKIIDTLRPKKIYSCNYGRYIIDFGQNISGFVRITLRGEKGKTIRIRTAEEIFKVNDCYELKLITNRGASSTDTYIMRGGETEIYNPSFTYHGFRYAEICGLDKKPTGLEVVACLVHTDFKQYVNFKTDNSIINRIHENALWSVRSNSLSFPSDCVARDERTPCLMDVFCYLKSAVYMFPPSAYFQRYLKSNDINELMSKRINMTWNGCLIALPWFYYKYYNNKAVAKRYYRRLKKLQIIYLNQCGETIPDGTFGDWCAPNDYGNYLTSFSSENETEYHMKYLTSLMMADMAKALKHEDDYEFFHLAAEKVRKKYIECFYNEAKGCFSGGKQAPNLYAMADGFVSEKERSRIAGNLIESIVENGNHLDVGIFGVNYFIEQLSEYGGVDVALDCFLNPQYPSFANQIAKGATTLWEQWCGTGDMSSHNHAMFAGAVSGFYTMLAGVTPLDIGFKSISIKPVLSKYIKKLEFGFYTVNGYFDMKYEVVDDKFNMSVHLPPNSISEVTLPNGEKYNIGNGKFKFCCSIRL